MDLPSELQALIISPLLVNLKSVYTIARVCHIWKILVFRIRWSLEGYLNPKLLTRFPRLSPSNFFFIFRSSESETALRRISKWVQNNKVPRVRLHIIDDGAFRDSRCPKIFSTLFHSSTIELMIRVHRTPDIRCHRKFRGIWYDREWRDPRFSERGKLVIQGLNLKYEGRVSKLIRKLQPVYLVTYEFDTDTDLTSGIRILGVGVENYLDMLGQSIEELRILAHSPLDLSHDEEYDVYESNLEMGDISFPKITSIRGSVPCCQVPAFMELFPNASLEVTHRPNCCPKSLTRTRPPTPWSFFTQNASILRIICSYLPLKDILSITQIFGTRAQIDSLPEQAVTMGVFDYFPFIHSIHGPVRVKTSEDLKEVVMFSCNRGASFFHLHIASNLTHQLLKIMTSESLESVHMITFEGNKSLIRLDSGNVFHALLPDKYACWKHEWEKMNLRRLKLRNIPSSFHTYPRDSLSPY